jgi:hypothetical protein
MEMPEASNAAEIFVADQVLGSPPNYPSHSSGIV